MFGKRCACLVLLMSGLLSGSEVPASANTTSDTDPKIQHWCADVKKAIRDLKWNVDPCKDIGWVQGGASVQGRPIVYAEFGDPKSTNTTLVFTMVHGDEITPLYLGIQLANWLQQRRGDLGTARVVIAPLVNPDSFFKRPRSRVNARGVDVNRNFPTRDWADKALKAWKVKFHSNPRRFPGAQPSSEPETLFQQNLIQKVKPSKILSIHAPLNFMDYDGPTPLALDKFSYEYVRECMKLRTQLKAISGGFFPGSLGNYAGQELGIPTLTLELPTANPRKAAEYWKKFSSGIRTMIEFVVPDYAATTRIRPSGG